MQNNSENFKEFLISEYSNIAQAHFKSIESISTFFRYYLLITSIPISSIAIILRLTIGYNNVALFLIRFKYYFFIIFLFISFIGLGVFCYIINLRLDVILYARTVNSIRKYFFDYAPLAIDYKLKLRVLPQSSLLPNYHEISYFYPVVTVFAIINTLFLFFSFYIIILSLELNIFFSSIYFIAHYLIYYFYSKYRDHGYLKSFILGIDIDGVLNHHREQFCNYIENNSNKELDPNNIIIIPVHEDTRLNISKTDTQRVFNDPKYWQMMPPVMEAADIIKSLKNIFRIKIFLFTWRPWPDSDEKRELRHLNKRFIKCCNSLSIIKKILLNLFPNKKYPIRCITKEWLKRNNFLYDKIYFENGNDNSSDPKVHIKNRFFLARKKKIRFFVEDDIEKAIKLSFICDIVFLLNHPYNSPNSELSDEINTFRSSTPHNIVRVNNWIEIYQLIRRFS